MESMKERFINLLKLLNYVRFFWKQKLHFIYPLKSQLNICPLYTNDSSDSSLLNTDMRLSSSPSPSTGPNSNPEPPAPGQGMLLSRYRDIATPGEDVMIFWTQLGLFHHSLNDGTFGWNETLLLHFRALFFPFNLFANIYFCPLPTMQHGRSAAQNAPESRKKRFF